VIEFYLCHDPADKLGEWRLTVEAHFSGKTPWSAYEAALRTLRDACSGIDGLVVHRIVGPALPEPGIDSCARGCQTAKTLGTGL
jgi:hypothetical protein